MTRNFNQIVNCPQCGAEFPAESAFCAWMRSRPELDSADGIVRTDADHIVHRYKFSHTDRNVQALMFIEVKTNVDFNKERLIPNSQADSLWIIDQLVRNRRSNIYKVPRKQCDGHVHKVYSLVAKKNVWVRFYGVHGLYFSGTNPIDSESIQWDRRPIRIDQLIKLLRFELDPDSLTPIDLRIHQKRILTLWSGDFSELDSPFLSRS